MSKKLTSSAIITVVIIAIFIVISTFLPIPKLNQVAYQYVGVRHMIQRFLAIILLLVSLNLYKRKYGAWVLTIILLAISLALYFIYHHAVYNKVIMLAEAYAFIVLIFNQIEFQNHANKTSQKRAIGFSIAAIVVVLLDAVVSYFRFHIRLGENITLKDSVWEVLDLLFDPMSQTSGLDLYERLIAVVVWVCVFGCVLFALSPVILRYKSAPNAKKKARELVKKYGYNPGSYLTLEDDKKLWFSEKTEGVVAYGILSDTIVVNGDPICAPKDFPVVLEEFRQWCEDTHLPCVFLGTNIDFMTYYEKLGYTHTKCGEDARFDLPEFDIAGKKGQKLRANLNHANKAGLTTYEYKPLEKQDKEIEDGINAVTEDWLDGKKSGMLGFTVGDTGLENPMDRRYFYAKDESGKIVAFNVYLPFDGMNGYMADVTRRTKDSPNGATEKLIYDAFMVFKDEGIRWGSMGLSPLSNIREEGEKDGLTEKVLEFAYNNFNRFYGFRDLHRAKEKYSPTNWVPSYFVYTTKTMTPSMAYAIIAIQNPGGIADFLKSLKK
jgi:phosphatidylglycerol lysyltransferase